MLALCPVVVSSRRDTLAGGLLTPELRLRFGSRSELEESEAKEDLLTGPFAAFWLPLGTFSWSSSGAPSCFCFLFFRELVSTSTTEASGGLIDVGSWSCRISVLLLLPKDSLFCDEDRWNRE